MRASIIPWLGGKSALAPKLLSMIPPHDGYIEAFGGAGHLLFAKEPAKWEVLNDIDSDLINFWLVVKHQKQRLIDSFEYTLVSRSLFNAYKTKYKKNEYDNEIQQAHIFYYLTRACFGARMNGPTFGTGKCRNKLKMENIDRDINRAYERLKKVTIECKDYADIVKTYDSARSFFFFDPPYRKKAKYKTDRFSDDDYMRLAKVCKSIKGKFLLTINDDEFIRGLFDGFHIVEHDVKYKVERVTSNVTGAELIITNYDTGDTA